MKPADVSREAWDQAETYKQLWARGPGTIKEVVARAITAAVAAEREACAALLDDVRVDIRDRFEAATAIRARSEP